MAATSGSPSATPWPIRAQDRKSTRLNSSHLGISYAVFCLKKKNQGLRGGVGLGLGVGRGLGEGVGFGVAVAVGVGVGVAAGVGVGVILGVGVGPPVTSKNAALIGPFFF